MAAHLSTSGETEDSLTRTDRLAMGGARRGASVDRTSRGEALQVAPPVAAMELAACGVEPFPAQRFAFSILVPRTAQEAICLISL